MVKITYETWWTRLLLFGGVVCSLFYRTITLGFFSDDYHFLHVTAMGKPLWLYFFTNNVGEAHGGSYGPVLNLLWSFQYTLFGLHSVFYHIVVLIVFVATAYLVERIIFLLTKDKTSALASAFIFLLLPVHVGSIAWIAVAPHIWATLFFLVSIYAYLRYKEEKKKIWYVGALVSLAFSVFTKESAIMYPVIFFLIEVRYQWKETKTSGKKIFEIVRNLVPFAVVGILYLLARYHIVGYIFGYYGGGTGRTIFDKLRMFTELSVNMLFTSPYRQMTADFLSNHKVWYVFGMVMFIALYLSYKKFRFTRLGLLISYVVLSIPFVSLMYHPHNDSGDRYAYLLSAIVAGMIGLFLVEAWRQSKTFMRGTISVLVLTAFIFSLVQINHVTKYWIKSAVVRERILNGVSAMDISKKDFVFFVGIPDNLSGAELFRNAIREAIDLETDKGYIEGIRIPIYSELSEARLNKELYRLSPSSTNAHSFQLVPSDTTDPRVFTGFPVWVDEFGTSTLHNFILEGSTGDSVTLEFKKEILAQLREKYDRIVLIYFDGLELRYEVVLN